MTPGRDAPEASRGRPSLVPSGGADVVADRRRLVEIGMVAVLVACVTFAITRFVAEQSSGQPTPWWANAIGAVLVAALHLWQRRAPEARTTMAANATAGIAAFALLVPAFYGFTSSKWWLSLVAFAMMLMGRRREAIVWSVTTVLLVGAVTVLEPYLAVANALGESSIETLGAAVAYVVILLGITWAFRRVAEQRARELAETAEQLDRANQVRTRFLAHMSHELRTPLHAVVAMTDLARRGEASDTVREQVSTAQQSALVLLDLLNNVLDVTRAEAGAITLDARPFALDALLTEVLQPQAMVAHARGLTLGCTADEGVPAERVGDRVRVAQIVLNLVANALKFTADGSVMVHVAAGRTPDHVRIEVRDTGRGIPADRLEGIFEPFAQAHRSDAALGGAGLGLAIVRELARRMEGSIAVESVVGKGSTFVVELELPPTSDPRTLPSSLLALRSSRVPSAPPTKQRGLRVLACDDDPVGRRVVALLLEGLGHTVTVAKNGRLAWEALANDEFELLVTDIEMPEMDGLELARRVRERERSEGKKRLAILAATAHVGKDEEGRLLDADIDGHLPKPFTESDLGAALTKLFPRSNA